MLDFSTNYFPPDSSGADGVLKSWNFQDVPFKGVTLKQTGILVLSPAEITKDMAHFLYLENDKIKSNTAKKTSENNKLHLWIDLFWLEIIVIFKTIY